MIWLLAHYFPLIILVPWFCTESIEWYIEDQAAFSPSYDLGSRPTISPSLKNWEKETTCSREKGKGGGLGAGLYNRKEAWPSINHSILSGSVGPSASVAPLQAKTVEECLSLCNKETGPKLFIRNYTLGFLSNSLSDCEKGLFEWFLWIKLRRILRILVWNYSRRKLPLEFLDFAISNWNSFIWQ